MSTTEPTVTRETAGHVLWYFEQPGGMRPGAFTQHLIAAIESADRKNEAILKEAYPELSAAVDLARHDEDGIAKLQQIARGVSA
jgi:hypothetical protein